MTTDHWANPSTTALALYLDRSDAPDRSPTDGSPMTDDDFLVLVNAWWEPLTFIVPATRPGQTWTAEINTYDPGAPGEGGEGGEVSEVSVGPRSITVLR